MTTNSLHYVVFDENGEFIDRASFDGMLASVDSGSVPTDVLVISHGWNNNFADASETYTEIIDQMTAVADTTQGILPNPYRPLILGVIWPSKAWNESSEVTSEGIGQGASIPTVASMSEAVYNALSPNRATSAGFRHDVLRVEQFLVKDRLTAAEAGEFRELLRRHADRPTLPEDESIFEPDAAAENLEGVASGDFSARDIFRTFTYWQMKKRASIVGQTGVRAAIAAAQQRWPSARFHLIGHSFGCKVILSAVAGPGDRLPRPIDTLILLQGAVSHEAMAGRVSGTASPGGYSAALDPGRVDGPIVATYSSMDRACSQAYPLGSRLAGQVGELEGLFDRFRALGAVGAMGIDADLDHRAAMLDINGAYSFSGRGVWSIDGGTPPGAFITGHSEIRTPQIAWLICSAIGRR
jgi:hypothetical protein